MWKTAVAGQTVFHWNDSKVLHLHLFRRVFKEHAKSDYHPRCVSVCPSVRPFLSTEERVFPPDGFLWFFIFGTFNKIWSKSARYNRHFTWRPTYIYVNGLYNGDSLLCKVGIEAYRTSGKTFRFVREYKCNSIYPLLYVEEKRYLSVYEITKNIYILTFTREVHSYLPTRHKQERSDCA